jgi:predicted transcriptional regulator
LIYFIQQGEDGPIKIGKSQDPEERLKALQSRTKTPLILLAVCEGCERCLHHRFADLRIRGEWFQPVHRLLNYIARFPRYQTGKAISKPGYEYMWPPRSRREKLLDMLKDHPEGLSRTDIRSKVFSRNLDKKQTVLLLQELESEGLIRQEYIHESHVGRPTQKWWAIVETEMTPDNAETLFS